MEIKRMAHNRRTKAQTSSSPAPCASIRCSTRRAGARCRGEVTFEPGARTAWHTHPLGQTLIVTAGSARAALGRPDRRDPARRRGLFPPARSTGTARRRRRR